MGHVYACYTICSQFKVEGHWQKYQKHTKGEYGNMLPHGQVTVAPYLEWSIDSDIKTIICPPTLY